MTLPISTVCENCGAALKLKNPDLIGKKVKCPKCGEPFVVSEAVAAKPKSAKKKSTDDDGFMNADLDDYEASPPDEDLDDEDDAPVRPRKSTTGKKKKGKKNRANGNAAQVVTIVAIVLVAGLVLGGSVYGFMAILAARPSDVDWLPEEIDGYFKIQVSRIWSSSVLQPVIADDGTKKFADEMEKNVGAAPQDVDQLIVGIQNTRAKGSEVVVVKFKQPFDLDKMQGTSANSEFVSHAGGRYLKSGKAALFLADPKTLVQGSESNIQSLMTRGKRNPAAAKFSFASGFHDHVVFAGYNKQVAGSSSMASPFGGFAGGQVMNAENILVQSNASTDIDVSVRTTFKSVEAAKEQVSTTQKELANAKSQFVQQKSQIQAMPANPQVNVNEITKTFEGLEQVMNSVNVAQSGQRVLMHLKISGQLVKDVAALTKSAPFARMSPTRQIPSFFSR